MTWLQYNQNTKLRFLKAKKPELSIKRFLKMTIQKIIKIIIKIIYNYIIKIIIKL